MSSGEKIKRILSFKQKLEKKVEELESELKELQATLEAVDAILFEKGFKRAEIIKSPAEKETLPPKKELPVEPPPSKPTEEYKDVIPLRAVSGELLATFFVGGDSLKVLPAEDKEFNVNTPPFIPFLVERVLAKMQEKDNERAKAGQIQPEKIFSYNIVRDGDIIREITIKHVDEDRLRELKSSIRWSLEKMHEKMKTQG